MLPTNGDFTQFQNVTGNWDPKNPSAATTANTIDPNLKNDTTDEFIVGVSHEVGRGFAVDANYIYRKYGNFTSTFTNGITSADYISTTYTPTCTIAGARCETVTAWYPSFQPGAVTTQLNTPNFDRTFNGLEVSGRKRMNHHWMMNTSFAYNSIIQNYGQGSYQNPNNIDKRNGFQYDYSTAGSGIGNVFVNAKWLYKLSGLVSASVQGQRLGVLQHAPGLPVRSRGRADQPDRPVDDRTDRHDAAEQRRHADDAAGCDRREPPADLPEPGPARRASGLLRVGALRAVGGPVQRHQQQHHPGPAREPERHQRRTSSRRSWRRGSSGSVSA